MSPTVLHTAGVRLRHAPFTPERVKSINKAAELADLTPSVLVYLSRNDILVPTGGKSPKRGRKRLYTFNDVIFLRVIADLLKKGIEVKRLRQDLQRARSESAEWINIRRQPHRLLVTDGTEIFVHKGDRLESKTVNRQFAFAFVLDLTMTHQHIARAWPAAADSAKSPIRRSIARG